jgi:acyl-CoA dehydrogenase
MSALRPTLDVSPRASHTRMLAQNLSDSDRAFCEAMYLIATTVADLHADDVDREARFPVEAVSAMREARVLSALVPPSLGGAGVSLEAIAEGCYALGRHCSAAAMVFAMHQIQMRVLVGHCERLPWFEDYLRRVVTEQRLIASITSEKGSGGDMGSSFAPLVADESGCLSFVKHAPTISYGADTDDFLTTVRRSESAPETDQVFVLHLGEDTTLTPQGVWDTLGMRGTCSPGFVVEARIDPAQVLLEPVSVVVTETMAASVVLWSHVWLGIATAAFDRAHRSVRASARRRPGEPLPAAAALSRLTADLLALRSTVRMGLADFLALDRESIHLVPAVLRLNNLKIAAADQAPQICLGALRVVGIAGYRNDSPYSVGRHLRDSLSASLMVSNDRMHATDAGLLTLAKEI